MALGQNLHLSVWGAPHVGDKVLHHLEGHLPLLVSFSPLLDVDLATEPTVQHIVSHQILAAQGQRGWSQPPWSGSFVQWHQRPGGKMCQNNINAATLKWSWSSHPRTTTLHILYLKTLECQTGQNNLWTGPKVTLYLKELLAKITRKQVY